YIVGSIAHKAHLHIRPAALPRQFDAVTKNLLTLLVAVAERAEGEELPQSAALQFAPANLFQISGYHADQLTLLLQGSQQLRNARANLDVHPVGVTRNFCAHQLQRSRQTGL